MSGELALILLNLVATLFMAGLIWTVQIVHYPLFAAVGVDAFPDYERSHQRRIAGLLAIPWSAEVLSAGSLVVIGPEAVSAALLWAGLLVALGLVLLTVLVFAPLHTALTRGLAADTLRRMVALNWLRTALWSAHAGIAVAILVQHVEP